MTTLNDDSNQIDLNLPGLGPDTIFAQAGGDSIKTSNLGGSLIFGEDDNDTITSVGPNDTIYGGNGEDSIRSQRTPALLFGEAGNDTIVAEARATIRGGQGEDFLQGTVEANLIFGNEDSDTILGGAQRRDTLYGGKGNDAIGFFLSSGGNNLSLPGGLGSVGFAGNEGSNYLSGNNGNDLVVGINVRDTLFGGKDNDTLRGVASSSYLSGDTGNDILSVTNSTQTSQFGGNVVTIGIEKTTLLGGEGNDSLTGPIGDFGIGKNFLRGDEGKDTITVFATQDTVLGGADDDLIKSSTTVNVQLTSGAQSSLPGFAGRNFLDGGSGNDTIVGAFSTDTIIGGDESLSGNDNLSGLFSLGSGGQGDDTINSIGLFSGTSTTSITLDGGLGNDLLVGNTNPAGGANAFNNVTITNIMNGGAGNDRIIFGTLRDRLSGDSAGNDFISYDSSVNFVAANRTTPNVINDDQGNNLIFGANGSDVITTGSGNDTLFGGPASLITAGDDGNDSLFSGAGNDVLVGGFGNDNLNGSEGDDCLVGGPGSDTLTGESGNDTFFYNNQSEGSFDSLTGGVLTASTGFSTSPDQIGDFTPGQDKLAFQVSGDKNGFPGIITGGNQLGQLSPNSFLFLTAENGTYTGQFAPATVPSQDSPFFFYQAVDGRLGYDPDGKNGIKPGVTIAILNGKPNISASDIILI